VYNHVTLFPDVDECLITDICGPHGICTNLNGSYECTCPEEFNQTESHRCTGIYNHKKTRVECLGLV